MSVLSTIETFIDSQFNIIVEPDLTKQIVPATLDSFQDCVDFLSWRVTSGDAIGVDCSATLYRILVQIYTSDRGKNNRILDSATKYLHDRPFKSSKFYRKRFEQVIRWGRWLTEIEFIITLPTSIGLGQNIEPPSALVIENIPVLYTVNSQ